MTHIVDALKAEMMTESAASWPVHSMARAYDAKGVEAPVSGDKIACIKAGPMQQLRLFRDRDQPMSNRLRSLALTQDQLWDEEQ